MWKLILKQEAPDYIWRVGEVNVKSCEETCLYPSLKMGARVQMGNGEKTPKFTDNLWCAAIPYIQSKAAYRYILKNACREN